jgi:hypothetical protein
MIRTLKKHYNLQVQVVQTKMNRIITHFFYAAFLLLFGVQCSNSQYDIQENEKLLKEYVGMFSEDDYPVFHQTMSKEKVSKYIGEGFSVDNVFFLADRPDSLDYYFDDAAINTLVKSVKQNYKQLTITQEQTNGHMVVQEEDIPEFVKDRSMPPSFNYSGFYNVYFLSTPIISQNRGIFFIDTYGASGIGITIMFYMRKNKDAPWVMVGSGAVHELEYYRKD